MKIKRFEAAGMAEALRLVKKEFGEEAVILSAKSLKRGGRMGGAAQRVVVTAAIDTPVRNGSAAAGAVADPAKPSAADQTRRSLWERVQPITRTGRAKLISKFSKLALEPSVAAAGDDDPLYALEQRLTREGVARALAEELLEKIEALLPAPNPAQTELQQLLAQVLTAKGLTADGRRAPRRLVLIGPCGVGKTTSAAKLATAATLQGQSVSLISIDRQRVAGAAELERYARILNVDMQFAVTPQELDKALAKTRQGGLIIDTPGLGPEDHDGRDYLTAMLRRIPAAEVHLLVNAALSDMAMQKTVEYFRSFSPQALIFTQLDWAATRGAVLNTAVWAGLPVTYLAHSPRVPDGLPAAGAQALARLMWPEPPKAEDELAVNVVPARTPPATELIANRNSDIFHRHCCRAVKRINDEHAVKFANVEEALGQSFKPCRMCCADLVVPKPIQRAARVAAGTR